jgi:hypothetical protein
MEELLEMVTWQQLGFHVKPVGVLNVNGFYDSLLAFFDKCVAEVRGHCQSLICAQAFTVDLCVVSVVGYQGYNPGHEPPATVHRGLCIWLTYKHGSIAVYSFLPLSLNTNILPLLPADCGALHIQIEHNANLNTWW